MTSCLNQSNNNKVGLPETSSDVTQELKTQSCTLTLKIDDNHEGVIDRDQEGIFIFPPTPTKNNMVFAGWQTDHKRINQNMNLDCNLTASAQWITQKENINQNRSIPILMYHYFTDNPSSPEIDANYQLDKDFDQQMNYLESNHFYYPTWQELEDFIDGKLSLPKKSVIITDDDNHPTFYDIGLPIIEKHHVFATMFAITNSQVWLDHKHPPSKYITEESHTDAMHTGAKNLIGYMIGLSEQEQIKDLQKSIKKLGRKDALAYPSGEFSNNSLKALKAVGIHLARTTKPGDVKIGSEKLELPCRRMSFGQSLASFKAVVG